ncbi:MAG: hypothetical protein ABSD27_03315 [Bryobacteraceae bacterium]|jgi:thioester reductase-like protein
MTIFTGVTGYLGDRLLKALERTDRQVRCPARPEKPIPPARGLFRRNVQRRGNLDMLPARSREV